MPNSLALTICQRGLIKSGLKTFGDRVRSSASEVTHNEGWLAVSASARPTLAPHSNKLSSGGDCALVEQAWHLFAH